MSAEVFRFVTIRPPQEVTSVEGDVVDLGLAQSPFVDSLRQLKAAGSRSGMIGAASTYTHSAAFIDSPQKIDKPIVDFILAVQQLPEHDFFSAATQLFKPIFGVSPKDYIKKDVFTATYLRSADSLVAAAIDTAVSAKVRALLVRIARIFWLIRRMADTAPVSRQEFVRAPLVVPEGVFPLPAADATTGLGASRKALSAAGQARTEARRKQLAALSTELATHRDAADELLTAFARTRAPAPNPAVRRLAKAEQARAGFLLSSAAAERLSESTKTILGKFGLVTTELDVATTVTLLEKEASRVAARLFAATGPTGTMVRIGNRIIPADALTNGLSAPVGGALDDTRSPGLCPPVISATPPEDSVTVPTGHGDARILGIADLLVVEQELLRYQLGEVAHIENVLKTEVRSRTFKTSDTIQQTTTIETETTQEKERDLASTERFELQTESQTVINQSASKDAGLTIHASYGPSIDATANFNASSSSSSEQSSTASTSFAREITNKAIDRVQTRTLTRRTVTTINVVEETNLHSFDNKTGNADVIGVYRFVDKIYRAQVVSYGKRLMLEFIVPEPAAFLRFALTNKPVENVTLVNPDPPGYCVGGTTFAPLQATDIARDNYLFWASKYGAQDVQTPPPSVAIASGSKRSAEKLDTVQSDGERKISSDLFDVSIPDGYLCQSAFVNIFGETQLGDHAVVFQIQDQQGQYVEPFDDGHLFTLHLDPTPTVTVSINSLGFHNWEVIATVFTTLSPEKFQEWQLKTFASIMNAYRDLKSAFDAAVKEARLQAQDGTISGTNPANNRVTEQTELKRGCISLLTGQRFDLFDAVNRNVAPFGHPEIDFAEAKAEGAYIQVFEQTFEWNNMVYLFYPYFWGKKSEWVTIAQLTDNDPLFGQFLRAGAARVQVPVRVGFEDAILTYLSTGELWAGEGTLVNSEGGPDTQHLSIIDELKSQSGNNNIEGLGTLNVTKNNVTVRGSGTAFTSSDESRRIVIGGATYLIKSVQDDETITITKPYTGDTAQGLRYALGGVLVGQPWEVKLPTNLVKLDNTLTFTP
jgi:hypothetical protein